MASLYVRGNSIWINYSIDGKLYRKPMKVKNTKQNYREALNRCIEIEEMLMNNIIPTDEDIIIKKRLKETDIPELKYTLDKLLEYHTSEMNGKNKVMYQTAFKKFQEVIETNIAVKDVNELHYNTFKKYMENDGLSYETQRTYINYMHIMMNTAIKRKLYNKDNPFIKLKRREKKFIRTITDEHFDLILEYLKETNIDIYRFIFFLRITGFRLNEALELTWQQIKWKENVIDLINFKNNNNHDLFPLNIEKGKLKEFLSSFKKDSGKIFNVSSQSITKQFQNAIKNFNVEKRKDNSKWIDIPKYTIHEIRKTTISKWAKKLAPFELKTMARHASISTTEKYYINMGLQDIAEKI